MPIPLAGYNTGGTVNGAAVAMTEWEVNPEVDDLDGTNTESGGFHVAVPGPVKAEITLTCIYDGAQNPYADTPAMEAGNYVAVDLFINDNGEVGGEPYWSFPSAMVKSAKTSAKIKEKVMFTATLVGSGEFTYPSGDVT